MIDWLLELKSNIDHHGIRWGLALTIFALYRKERRNLMLDKRDEAIFHNLKVLMEERGLGAQWRGQVKVSNGEVQSLKKLYSSLQEEISRVSRSKGRKRRMPLNKSWLAAVVVYFITLAVQRYHINLPAGWENDAFTYATYAVQGTAFMLAAWWNKRHKLPVPQEPVYTATAPKTYEDIKPIIKAVHEGVNGIYADVQSGKMTDATQEAIDLYLKLNTVLQQRKAGETDAGTKAG